MSRGSVSTARAGGALAAALGGARMVPMVNMAFGLTALAVGVMILMRRKGQFGWNWAPSHPFCSNPITRINGTPAGPPQNCGTSYAMGTPTPPSGGPAYAWEYTHRVFPFDYGRPVGRIDKTDPSAGPISLPEFTAPARFFPEAAAEGDPVALWFPPIAITPGVPPLTGGGYGPVPIPWGYAPALPGTGVHGEPLRGYGVGGDSGVGWGAAAPGQAGAGAGAPSLPAGHVAVPQPGVAVGVGAGAGAGAPAVPTTLITFSAVGVDVGHGWHHLAPPPPMEKQRKVRLRGGVLALRQNVVRGVNPVTEVCDAVDALFKALPDTIRARYDGEFAVNNTKPGKPLRQGAYWKKIQFDRYQKTGRETYDRPERSRWAIDRREAAGELSRSKRASADTPTWYSKPRDKGLGCDQKAALVYKHADDLNIPQALHNLALEGLIDIAFGVLGSTAAKAARSAGRPIGYQTGPVF